MHCHGWRRSEKIVKSRNWKRDLYTITYHYLIMVQKAVLLDSQMQKQERTWPEWKAPWDVAMRDWYYHNRSENLMKSELQLELEKVAQIRETLSCFTERKSLVESARSNWENRNNAPPPACRFSDCISKSHHGWVLKSDEIQGGH